MRKYAWLVAAVALVGLVGCGSDRDKLQGTWTAEKGESAGGSKSGDELKDTRVVFSGDKVTLKMFGAEVETTYSIDPGKNPKTIDFAAPKGKENEKAILAIYTFEGDKLKLAFTFGDQSKRPADFNTGKDSPTFVLTFKR